jgi:hypothetical protein
VESTSPPPHVGPGLYTLPQQIIREFFEQIRQSTPPLHLLKKAPYVSQLRAIDIARYIDLDVSTLNRWVLRDPMAPEAQRKLSWFITQWNNGELEKVEVAGRWVIRRRESAPQTAGERRLGIDINAPGGPRLKLNGDR